MRANSFETTTDLYLIVEILLIKTAFYKIYLKYCVILTRCVSSIYRFICENAIIFINSTHFTFIWLRNFFIFFYKNISNETDATVRVYMSVGKIKTCI